MYTLSLIGIGAGNPKHLTLQAIDALNGCDLILIPRKGAQKDDLAALRREICAQVLNDPGPDIREFDLPQRDADNPQYRDGVDDWHDAIADAWLHEIRTGLPDGGRVGFLVWGDPSLYDSTMRIAERLETVLPLSVEIIPGITSLQALTAGHVIPLNTIGDAVTITTGRQLRQHGWPTGARTVAVMLDGTYAFQSLPQQPQTDIWWSAYAGMPNEIRISGPLHKVTAKIIATRAEARADHGWIMDIYLLRRDVVEPECA
ncbi:precorrin-6A synthase (deacetylating) [Pseudosulfitobacter sp. DSM 107133]|uniref:precorrin-6A synthase (deacetylating) n=1 Tax=Pseudosulfitobacter sp. DSM 107133 TaxID=2883100 RepID=UPI000DF1145A|nr:precorrin-6A synthase (deacetylating) [Pseudosulfitobacter sp. DSM 107133]UOA28695.1 Precorrin-2 C(20)-methyltransferase [Pseudosulfitobacter sp. DSM 107133]